jgi:serine/threonine protein kinase
MELCAQSLTTLVERVGALPPDDVVVLGYALTLALAVAHDAGILHGGVSPDNVLFRASGEPILADFGVPLREAFPRDPLHAIECVAPEALRSGEVDERADLYGLGAVLHFALTGRSPHPGRLGEQPGERVLRVLGSPVPAINRPGVPVGLSTVVARLLAPDAAHRPPDAARVAEQFAGMLGQNPPVTTFAQAPVADDFDDFAIASRQPEPGAGPALATTARPRSLRRYFLAGGVVLAGLLAGTFMLLSRNNSDELRTTPRLPPPPASAAAPPAGAATAVRLDLADPVDLGNQVVLNWTSDATLDFAVIVAGEGEPNHTVLAQRNQTMTIPVDPVEKYCFVVQAADGNQVYETQSKGIRGATCRH